MLADFYCNQEEAGRIKFMHFSRNIIMINNKTIRSFIHSFTTPPHLCDFADWGWRASTVVVS